MQLQNENVTAILSMLCYPSHSPASIFLITMLKIEVIKLWKKPLLFMNYCDIFTMGKKIEYRTASSFCFVPSKTTLKISGYLECTHILVQRQRPVHIWCNKNRPVWHVDM